MWKEWKDLKNNVQIYRPPNSPLHHFQSTAWWRVFVSLSFLVVENNHRYPHNNCRRTPVPRTLPPSPSGLHPWLLVWCKSTAARPSGILTRMLNMILGLITWPENTPDSSASQFKHRLHIVSWMSAYPEVCKARVCFYSYELMDVIFFQPYFRGHPLSIVSLFDVKLLCFIFLWVILLHPPVSKISSPKW